MQNKNQDNTQAHYSAKKIKNWNEYNQALENRGNFSLWLDIAILNNQAEQTGRAGRPYEYSDALILFLAQLREFMQLPLRQTIGVAKGIFLQAGLALPLPKHNTLGRRMSDLKIPTNLDKIDFSSPIIFLPDSTGLKVSGEGEWKVKKHGADKRREWVGLHIGIDHATQMIVSHTITNVRTHDCTQLKPLLDKLPGNVCVRRIIGDGAYGTRGLYKLAKQRKVELVSPPEKNAVYHGKLVGGELVDDVGWEVRNGYVRDIARMGRAEWKVRARYHKRSLVETAMFRLKRAFGGHLKSRTKRNQAAEINLRISLLNLFTSYGMPRYDT